LRKNAIRLEKTYLNLVLLDAHPELAGVEQELAAGTEPLMCANSLILPIDF
jgi:hypothetical protein